MKRKPTLFIYSKDDCFFRNIKPVLKEAFKIKRVFKETDLLVDNFKSNDILLLDIAANSEKIPDWFSNIKMFKVVVYDKFVPENINEMILYSDYYLGKSMPAIEFSEKMKRISLLLEKDLNPITFLPGNVDFENEYISSVTENNAIAFIDIDNFKYFHSAKGAQKSEALLRMLSAIIRRNIFIIPLKKTARAYNIFLDRFAIIAEKDDLMRICSFIYEDFSRYKSVFFDNAELTRQFFVMQDRTGNIYDIPVTTISMVLITRYFLSVIELYKTAEDIFRYLKSKGGNLIFSDRRQSQAYIQDKGTILIAVYDQLKSNYLKISLERLGWKIFAANDGITALKLYNRVKPSIIILDESLPLIGYKDFISVLRYELFDNRTIIVLLSEIDEWINSQYKFSTLSKDINAEKINQKLIALISQSLAKEG